VGRPYLTGSIIFIFFISMGTCPYTLEKLQAFNNSYAIHQKSKALSLILKDEQAPACKILFSSLNLKITMHDCTTTNPLAQTTGGVEFWKYEEICLWKFSLFIFKFASEMCLLWFCYLKKFIFFIIWTVKKSFKNLNLMNKQKF